MKPSSTTAPVTAFCAAKVEGPYGFLWIDGNGKITAWNGTISEPRPNAFSLVQVEDCPGATETCKASCYVHNLEKHAPDTHALYRHNSQTIRRILAYGGDVAVTWAGIFGEWITKECLGGFRWHVSGDVFSARYAQWIALVCSYSPSVNHWIYTRSFSPSILSPLAATRNLALNLSCDVDNYTEAAALAPQYGARLCYLTLDGFVPAGLPRGSVIFPDYALRGGTTAGVAWFASLPPEYKSFVCPVDYHGKDENRRCGPCDRCLKK